VFSGLSLAEEASGDVAHVGLLQLVVLATHLIDADIFEGGDDSLDVKAHGDETVDELFVVSVVSAVRSVYAYFIQVPYVRRELDLLLILLCRHVLLLNRLGGSTSAALGNLLLGCSSVLDGPLPRLVLEFGRIPDQHAGHFGVLRIFWFGCAEE
jgi:hypothetical protein